MDNTEKVIDHIMNQVRQGAIPVGNPIPSAEILADRLSVSPEEAEAGIQALSQMGLAEKALDEPVYTFGTVRNSFTQTFHVLQLLGIATMKDVNAFRKSMDLAIYEMAFHNYQNNSLLPKMKAVLKDFLRSTPEEQIRLDNEFHFLLISMADNPLLMMVMRSMEDIYRKWVQQVLLSMPEKGIKKLHDAHCKIYQSLLDRDKASGLEAIDEHYYLIDLMADNFGLYE